MNTAAHPDGGHCCSLSRSTLLLTAGAVALAVGPALPFVSPDAALKCPGWVCCSPLPVHGRPPQPNVDHPAPRPWHIDVRARIARATDLWHLRPLLAAVVVAVAMVALAAGVLAPRAFGRGAAFLGLIVAGVLIADARRSDGVDVVAHGQQASTVHPSAWVLVPLLGAVALVAALLATAPPAAPAGPTPTPPTAPPAP